MRVIVTICSKAKDTDSELLPAKERYQGDHVHFADTKARETGTPLYILSGKFGLISGDDFIPDYDYYLEKANDELVRLVKAQIEEVGIIEIDFYVKNSEKWASYRTILSKAAKLAEIRLNELEL